MNAPDTATNVTPEWCALSAVCLAAIIVNADVALKPLLLASYIGFLHFDTQDAAYLVAIEASATAVATALAAAFVNRFTRSRTMLLALIVIGVANALSLVAESFPLLAGVRALAGLGHGTGLAVVAASIASFRQPDRAAGVMTMAASLAGTLMMLGVPQAQGVFGAAPIFWLMGALILPPLVFLRALPARRGVPQTDPSSPAPPPALFGRLTLVSLLVAAFFYLSVGAFGPFSAQLGLDAGLSYQQSGAVLALAGVASMLGAITAIAAADRFGRVVPVVLSVLGAGASLGALLIAPQSQAVFRVAVPAFFFCWASVYPYLMGFASRLDPTGRVNGLFFTLSLLGFAAGPAIGGMLTSFGRSTHEGLANVVLFSLLCLIPALGFAPVIKAQERNVPSA